MTIKERLQSELKTAMKEHDAVLKNVVTLVRAAILQYEKDNLKECDEEHIIELISKQVKQRKDALADFEKAGRDDLIAQTNRELEILLSYLPRQLSPEELEEIVKEAIDRLGIDSKKGMGALMKDVMPRVKGMSDGKAINAAAAKFLN
ncbi:MAG: GatB/YqeY domain-containing protein [Eubacteriaceae bacterium]|nr:GatB/YqeY domain-containing protein [Eubacteriaceae bacterium]